jgi:hypothetical protein
LKAPKKCFLFLLYGPRAVLFSSFFFDDSRDHIMKQQSLHHRRRAKKVRLFVVVLPSARPKVPLLYLEGRERERERERERDPFKLSACTTISWYFRRRRQQEEATQAAALLEASKAVWSKYPSEMGRRSVGPTQPSTFVKKKGDA